jgi:hypothetical protein
MALFKFGSRIDTAAVDLLSAARGDHGQLKRDLKRLQTQDHEREVAEFELLAVRAFVVTWLLEKHCGDQSQERLVFEAFVNKVAAWLGQKPKGQTLYLTFLERHQQYHTCFKADPLDSAHEAARHFAIGMGRNPSCGVTLASFAHTFNETAKMNEWWIKRLKFRDS